MVDKIDPIIDLNTTEESLKPEPKFSAINGMQSKTVVYFKPAKLLFIIVTIIIAIGLSYYWLIFSNNIMQAFIPYDEDRAALLPDNDFAHNQTHINDKRLLELEQKLTQLSHQFQESNRLPDAENTQQPAEVQFTDLKVKIDQIEQRLDSYAAHQKKVIDIYLSFEQLKADIDCGNAYEATINHFMNITRAYNDAQNILHPLIEYASIGVASYAQLQEELANIMSKHKIESRGTINHDKWWDRAVNTLKSIIKVRRVADNDMSEFRQLYEIYPKVETLLSLSDIKPAVELMAVFEKDFSPPEHNFYQQMMARMIVEDSLSKMKQLLSSSGFIQFLNTPQ